MMRYMRAFLTHIPLLAKTIQREAAEAFDLIDKVTIEVTTANQRATRGYSYAAVLCDEIAFWPTDDTAPIRTTRFSTPFVPAWRQSLLALICASPPTPDEAPFGRLFERLGPPRGVAAKSCHHP